MDNTEQRIIDLLDERKGDQLRLADMLNRFQSGKSLYNSDYTYLDKLSPTLEPKIEEKPINLDELRKSQPKPKYKKYSIKFGVSHSQSGRSSTKLHKASCRYVQNSSQSGDIKWDHCCDFQAAKNTAIRYGDPSYPKCCMKNFPLGLIFNAFLASLIFGIFGGLLAWYFTKDYFPRLAKGWFLFSLFSTSYYLSEWINNLF